MKSYYITIFYLHLYSFVNLIISIDKEEIEENLVQAMEIVRSMSKEVKSLKINMEEIKEENERCKVKNYCLKYKKKLKTKYTNRVINNFQNLIRKCLNK